MTVNSVVLDGGYVVTITTRNQLSGLVITDKADNGKIVVAIIDEHETKLKRIEKKEK